MTRFSLHFARDDIVGFCNSVLIVQIILTYIQTQHESFVLISF